MFDGKREPKTGDALVNCVFGFSLGAATDGHSGHRFCAAVFLTVGQLDVFSGWIDWIGDNGGMRPEETFQWVPRCFLWVKALIGTVDRCEALK